MRRTEGEPIESQTPHCPTCDRSLERISDYPKIIIRNLTISALPNVDYPRRHADDLTLVKELSKNQKIKDYLVELTSVKGQVIKLSDIKPDLPQYENDEGVHDYFKVHKTYYLHISDRKVPGVARVMISKHINSGNLGWGFLEVVELAKIRYEGVLNYPQFTEV